MPPDLEAYVLEIFADEFGDNGASYHVSVGDSSYSPTSEQGVEVQEPRK
ncbi:MAG: hypothetical protein R3F34_08130 [Planctomycetota bacterium]